MSDGELTMGQLATQLSAIEDWLRGASPARHSDDMADVIHQAWRLVENLTDLYDQMTRKP